MLTKKKILPDLLLFLVYITSCFFAEQSFNINFDYHSPYQKELIFEELQDVRIWATIGEMMKDDEDIEIIYGEKTTGLGASFTINGKKEHCHVSYTAFIPNKHISYLYEALDEEKDYLSKIDLRDSDTGTIVTFETKSIQKLPFFIRGLILLSGITKTYENLTKNKFINLDDP